MSPPVEPAGGSRFDVTIIGGGPAGLSAALLLGRMRRRVLLVDGDEPAHAVSEGVHGFLAQDGTPPHELRRSAQEQLRPYETVALRKAVVEAAAARAGGFRVEADGSASDSSVLLLATGMRYELPPVEGAAETWGRGTFHCPYCHGWEVRGRALAAYGTDAVLHALLLTSLSDDVVLLTDGGAELDRGDTERLRETGVILRHDRVARLEAEDGELARVVFADGSSDERAGLFFVPAFTPSPLAGQLGCELDETGGAVVDEDCRTNISGVFAAGDATAGKKAVALAAASGARAAYAINAGLASGQLGA